MRKTGLDAGTWKAKQWLNLYLSQLDAPKIAFVAPVKASMNQQYQVVIVELS
jgi:hypothetical protein